MSAPTIFIFILILFVIKEFLLIFDFGAANDCTSCSHVQPELGVVMRSVCFFLAVFPCHSPPSYAREDHKGCHKPESVYGASFAPLPCEGCPCKNLSLYHCIDSGNSP